jgi:hypothetical protein
MAISSLTYIMGFSVRYLKKNFTEKPRTIVNLLIVMLLQLKFELILIYNKAAMDN